jgi:transposase
VQIASIWVRDQRESELTQWYLTRFAHAGPRARKVGIVAVARRLMIDLSRYLDTGVVPAGARLRPAKRTARAGATRAA